MQKKSRMGALDPLGPIKLPTVRGSKDSPFKGFLDISIVSQKMRSTLGTAGAVVRGGPKSVKNASVFNTLENSVGF